LVILNTEVINKHHRFLEYNKSIRGGISLDIKQLLKSLELPESIEGTCPIQNLQKNKLSFFERTKFVKFIKPDTGSYILTKEDLRKFVEDIPGNQYIFVKDPSSIFLKAHNAFHQDRRDFKSDHDIHPTAFIGKNVKLGKGVVIGAHVTIGNNVEIGDYTIIHPNVTIYDNVIIGKNCKFDSGVVLGAQGYQRLYDENGRPHQMVHVGGVKIGNRVELGSNCTVDRGTFNDTIIEDDVKVDNHNHIAHNDVIKRNTRLAASICIGGSTVIGEGVWIGVGATLSDNIEVGDGAEILMGAVVASSVPPGARVAGFYAMDNKSWRMFMKKVNKDFVLNRGKTKK
jgi:UDP-3-O-[3-hydroxymyristoyl] glucosamine N-acyltransferase